MGFLAGETLTAPSRNLHTRRRIVLPDGPSRILLAPCRTRSTMRHSSLVSLAALVVSGVGACREAPRAAATQGAAAAAPQLTRTDRLLLAAASIALPPEGVAPGDLPEPDSRGAQLVAKFCAQCHALPAPTQHSATDWPSVVRRMWLRMEWLPDSLGVQVPADAEIGRAHV